MKIQTTKTKHIKVRRTRNFSFLLGCVGSLWPYFLALLKREMRESFPGKPGFSTLGKPIYSDVNTQSCLFTYVNTKLCKVPCHHSWMTIFRKVSFLHLTKFIVPRTLILYFWQYSRFYFWYSTTVVLRVLSNIRNENVVCNQK